MNKYGNDIFVGEFNVSDDGCDVDGRSESSYDSSSSEERSKKVSKRRTTKVHTTPGSAITLQPDAFRGAMNPEEVSSRNNGVLRNPGGDNNQEDSGNDVNNSSRITPLERYDPLANESGDETTKIHHKRKHRKNRNSGRSKRTTNAFKRGGYYNMLEKFLEDEPGISMDDRSTKVVTYTCNTKETIPVEFNLPRKSNDVLGLG